MGMAGSARPAATHSGPSPTDSRARSQHGNIDSLPGDSSGVEDFNRSILPPPLRPLRGRVRARSVSRQPLRARQGLRILPGAPNLFVPGKRAAPARSAAQRSAPLLLPGPRGASPARSFPAAAGAARSRGQLRGPGAAGRGGRGPAAAPAASPSRGRSARPPGRSVGGVGLSGTSR